MLSLLAFLTAALIPASPACAAQRVLVGDVNGDGRPERVAVEHGRLVVRSRGKAYSTQLPAPTHGCYLTPLRLIDVDAAPGAQIAMQFPAGSNFTFIRIYAFFRFAPYVLSVPGGDFGYGLGSQVVGTIDCAGKTGLLDTIATRAGTGWDVDRRTLQISGLGLSIAKETTSRNAPPEPVPGAPAQATRELRAGSLANPLHSLRWPGPQGLLQGAGPDRGARAQERLLGGSRLVP